MKTFKEFFQEIVESDELKKAYENAVKSGKEAVEAFLKENGCEGTVEDVENFYKELRQDRELKDVEIDKIVGGISTDGGTGDLVVSLTFPWACRPSNSQYYDSEGNPIQGNLCF